MTEVHLLQLSPKEAVAVLAAGEEVCLLVECQNFHQKQHSPQLVPAQPLQVEVALHQQDHPLEALVALIHLLEAFLQDLLLQLLHPQFLHLLLSEHLHLLQLLLLLQEHLHLQQHLLLQDRLQLPFHHRLLLHLQEEETTMMMTAMDGHFHP